MMERLQQVAPLDVFYRRLRPRNLSWAGEYERALAEFEREREKDPDLVDLHIPLVYFMLGRLEDAHREAIAFDKMCGAACDWSREARERGWAEDGFEGAARAWLEQATAIPGYPSFLIALEYATIGENDEALAWLERTHRERGPLLAHLEVMPQFDPLRSDPRFQDLLRRIGFPESPDAP